MTALSFRHPEHEIEDHDQGLLIRFRLPQSTVGGVEIVLSVEEANDLVDHLEQAIAFGDDR